LPTTWAVVASIFEAVPATLSSRFDCVDAGKVNWARPARIVVVNWVVTGVG